MTAIQLTSPQSARYPSTTDMTVIDVASEIINENEMTPEESCNDRLREIVCVACICGVVLILVAIFKSTFSSNATTIN